MPPTIPPILIALGILCLIAGTHITIYAFRDEDPSPDPFQPETGDPGLTDMILRELAQATTTNEGRN